MNNDNQRDVNVNQQKFLNQLEQLAIDAATAQAQIASDAAKHEFNLLRSVARSTRIYQSICTSYIH